MIDENPKMWIGCLFTVLLEGQAVGEVDVYVDGIWQPGPEALTWLMAAYTKAVNAPESALRLRFDQNGKQIDVHF